MMVRPVIGLRLLAIGLLALPLTPGLDVAEKTQSCSMHWSPPPSPIRACLPLPLLRVMGLFELVVRSMAQVGNDDDLLD